MLAVGGSLAAILFGIAACAVAVPMALRARRTFTAATNVPAVWSAPRNYLVTDDGLASSTALTSTRWSWQAVRRVGQRPEAYLFWQDGPTVFDLPRAPLTTGQETELQALLAGRGLLSPIRSGHASGSS